ncbi:MAG: PilZ domain-containing protein [Myxococcales bacterium]|nr:PilZ domain-containing protein [Myxococcales bacterium]MBL8626892.1 PilZ domain-containing protein [Myxococcales bacterium]MBP6847227.1 PilZ domain-containing protein [Kofleriaceae bacterium]
MKPPSVAWDGSSTRSPSPRGVDPVAVAGDKRIHIRFDMLFPCVMASELYGEAQVVVRNVSAGGMMVQTADILPLGAVVTVHFRMSDCDDEIVARAEVKHHLCLNFGAPGAEPRAARAMGLRFLDFDTELPLTLASQRVLH